MLTDIEIAQQATLQPITKIAADLGITEDELIPYGRYKAKLDNAVFHRLENEKDGKLILVTAINPTPAGEGLSLIHILSTGWDLTGVIGSTMLPITSQKCMTLLCN